MSFDISIFTLSGRARRIFFIVWLLAMVVGFLSISMLIDREQARDVQSVEIQLGLVAGSHSNAIANWVTERQSALYTLANNVSLKLYMTELELDDGESDGESDEPAQLTYIRNLIVASANAGGFAPAAQQETLPVNSSTEPAAGIALYNYGMQPIVSTRYMPEHTTLPASLTRISDEQAHVISEPFRLANGQPVVGFRLPVHGVQQDEGSTPLGYVFAVAQLGSGFFQLLHSVGSNQPTAESILLSPHDGVVDFVSPLQNGTPAMQLTLEAENAEISVQAAAEPGAMQAGYDYRDEAGFALAKKVEKTPWVVARKIDYTVALAETRARTRMFYWGFILIAGLATTAFIALWRHATALRAKQAASYYRSLSHRIQKQEELLELIAENTPVSTFILDHNGQYCYANAQSAKEAKMERRDLIGKKLDAVLGRARALPLLQANENAIAEQKPRSNIVRREEKGELVEVLESQHIPLDAIPLPDREESVPGVLVIEQDITDVVREEERRASTLQQLIDTLVAVVDKRDPNAAHHSACVAMVAEGVAREMRLDETLIHTAGIAGRLMNIGKIMVPENMLTSKTLKKEEKEQIRESMQAGAELLSGIRFDGPVVDTLKQAQEHVDGSGPMKLKDDAILPTAKIIRTANDFVAMVSARSYRDGMSMEEAMNALNKDSGKLYDGRVLAALANYIVNAGGREAVETHINQEAKST